MTVLTSLVALSVALVVGGLLAFWAYWAARISCHLAWKLISHNPEEPQPPARRKSARIEKLPERRQLVNAA